MIHCEHLEKSFHTPAQPPRHWHLDELHIDRGERVLITGPSGCGKTTLFNLLAGLLQPDAGTITIDDMQVTGFSLAEADRFRGRRLGLIFQTFQLIPAVTVLDNLLLGARYGHACLPAEAHTRALALLEQVGLRDRAGASPRRLSIGEQQRVAIARALINEPPVLLADEPTASLDTRNTGMVLDLLFTLCAERHTTLLMVSHQTDCADRFDRRIAADGWMRAEEVAHV